MKAIILAAGKGSRLNKYTNNIPKGMLKFSGKSLIERQIEIYRKNGINDISIVTGYLSEKINFDEVKYYENTEYDSTNMVESLFKAKEKLNGEIIVSYADIIFDQNLLDELLNSNNHINITVDTDWQDYWKARYGKIDFDLESLEINSKNNITSIGQEVNNTSKIDGRYVGIIKFSRNGLNYLNRIYEESKNEFSGRPWQISGNNFENAYMTDLFQEFIDRKIDISAVCVKRGWLEFDTNEDYERMTKLLMNNSIQEFIRL